MKISFKLKLIFSYVFIIVISFGIIAFFLDRSLEANSLREITASLVTEARLVESIVTSRHIREADFTYLDAAAKTLAARMACRLTVIDGNGNVLADSEKTRAEVRSMENHAYRPEVRAALAGNTGTDTHRSSALNIDMLYVAVPLTDEQGVAGILRLAIPLDSVQRTLLATRKAVISGFIFALALALILGSLVASQTIRPINRMIGVSRRFAEGDFSRRVIPGPQDEIGELAETLNGMAQDIEEKIREIETQNQKLAAIFDSMIEGVIAVDRAGHVISVNPTIERIFRVRKEEVEGRLFLEGIRNKDIAEVIRRTLSGGTPQSGEAHLLLPVRKVFQINAVPVSHGGDVTGCVVVIHDITELRRLETVRTDFVANVSHELKTPLTSIKGFVETLLEGAIDDKENNRAFLGIIQEHADRLSSLVNDLLALSHLESKEITLTVSDVDLHREVEKVIQSFTSSIRKRGITVTNELPVGFSGRADRNRIDQVLTNLIDNAIKFNKDGGSIAIRGRRDAGAVTVTVEDSGCGIPAQDLPRIFERFYRVDKARSRDLGGTGLGLAIVKHIIALHGGTVAVESSEGHGARFRFTLPL